MTEALSYILLMSIALVFCLRSRLVPSGSVFLCLFFVFGVALSWAVRSAGYDADMETYEAALSSNSRSFYYWREPYFWIGARVIYQMTGSGFATFVIYDSVAILMIGLALRVFRTPQYAYFAFLLFFPVVLGMQNAYRQWLSECAFLLAFSLSVRGRRGGYFWGFVAILAHNSAALFAPLVALLKKGKAQRWAGWVAIVCIPGALLLLQDSKSSASTGIDLALGFVVAALMLGLFLLITNRMTIIGNRVERYMVVLGLIVTWSALSVLSSAGTERLSMFFLIVAFPVFVNHLETRFVEKRFVRMAMTTLGFAPLLAVEASYMLHTG